MVHSSIIRSLWTVRRLKCPSLLIRSRLCVRETSSVSNITLALRFSAILNLTSTRSPHLVGTMAVWPAFSVTMTTSYITISCCPRRRKISKWTRRHASQTATWLWSLDHKKTKRASVWACSTHLMPSSDHASNKYVHEIHNNLQSVW